MNIISSSSEKKLQAVIRKAGKQIMQYWPANKSLLKTLKVMNKPDGSLVTDADLLSNALIVKALSELFPSDAILSEEDTDNVVYTEGQRMWILDPLDGTKTFLEGNDDFAILLALAVAGELSYAILYQPARNILATAKKGFGASVNGKLLKVSKYKKIRPGKLYLRHLQDRGSSLVFPTWLDSGQACLSLCSGKLDSMIVKIKSHQEWDLAAAVTLITESGGLVTDQNGNSVRFGCGNFQCQYLVASNSKVHDQALGILQKLICKST